MWTTWHVSGYTELLLSSYYSLHSKTQFFWFIAQHESLYSRFPLCLGNRCVYVKRFLSLEMCICITDMQVQNQSKDPQRQHKPKQSWSSCSCAKLMPSPVIHLHTDDPGMEIFFHTHTHTLLINNKPCQQNASHAPFFPFKFLSTLKKKLSSLMGYLVCPSNGSIIGSVYVLECYNHL